MPLTKFSPISNVKLCKVQDVDRSYCNIKRFSNAYERSGYYSQFAEFSFSQVEPIREPNSIRLNIAANKASTCNYVMFQNANWGVKWFYGFITSVDFININCCKVNVEIDIFQTWFLDGLTLAPQALCVRSHVYQKSSERIGDNMTAETLKVSNYYMKELNAVEFNQGVKYLSFFVYDGNPSMTSSYGEVAYPFQQLLGDDSTTTALLQTQGDKVKVIIAVPASLDGSKHDITVPSSGSDISGYKPKNKKCFTYPYNYIDLFAYNGQTMSLRYEYFASNKKADTPKDVPITIETSIGMAPAMFAYPKDYKENPDAFSTIVRPADIISITDFPRIPVSGDALTNWVNSGGREKAVGNIIASTLTSAVLPIVLGGMTGGAGAAAAPVISDAAAAAAAKGAVAGFAGGVLKTVAEVGAVAAQPASCSGGSSGSELLQSQNCNFYYKIMQASREDIERIDNFFEVYGYADGRLRQIDPNIGTYWCYWQTATPAVINYTFKDAGADNTFSSVPAGVLDQMNACFLRGLTFWDKDTRFGDYSKDNHGSW